MITQRDMHRLVEGNPKLLLRMRDNTLRHRDLLFGQRSQHFLQMAVLIRIVFNKDLLDSTWIDDIVLPFLISNPGAHYNLLFTAVERDDRIVVQNFFDLHDSLLCLA
ncbi:hypothetical protein D3C73_1448230 [compost metagenome]